MTTITIRRAYTDIVDVVGESTPLQIIIDNQISAWDGNTPTLSSGPAGHAYWEITGEGITDDDFSTKDYYEGKTPDPTFATGLKGVIWLAKKVNY